MKNDIIMGILAHVDAGKTTLSESIMYLTGRIRRLGRVDDRDAYLDTDQMEKERGITIFSKQANFELEGQPFTILDTPGHVDFSAETERTLQVLDLAILVVSAADGVQGHTQTLWRLLADYGVPTFIFVNKMDQPGADQEALLADIHRHLSDSCVDFTLEEEARLDQLAMCSEEAMESYLETGEIPAQVIRQMIRDRQVFPCFFGSALKLTGIDTLLAGLGKWALPGDYGEAFGARVFKIFRGESGQRLTYMKITGGQLRVRDMIGDEKVTQLRIYSGSKYETADCVRAGSICAVMGLTGTRAGDGLGAERQKKPPVLEPILTCNVTFPLGPDLQQALQLMRQLEEEEPGLHVVWEEELQEIHVRLMGQVQTEILTRMLQDRFGVHAEFGQGRILYKETIEDTVEGIGHFEPLRHYAEVHLRLEPGEPGSGLEFASECTVNDLELNWQRLILTHLKEKVHKGVLTGAPITDMKITLIAGKAHRKHTEGGDFRQATYRAVRQGLMKAKSVLLEPYDDFVLEVPSAQMGRAMADLEMGSCSFTLSGNSGELCEITGRGPSCVLRAYPAQVMAYTGGRGRLSFSQAGYYPCHNAQEVWEAAWYDPCADLRNTPDSVFCVHGAGYVVPWYEVEQYMHLESSDANEDWESSMSQTPPSQAAQTQILRREATERREAAQSDKLSRGLYASAAMDKELEAIFTRTYGEIRPKLHDTTTVIGRPKEKEYVYKPPKKKGDMTHYLLVDGYNIIFGWPELAELARHDMSAARDKLMETLSDYQGYTEQRIILVFDAYKVAGFQGEVIHWQNIDVVFTKEAETADQYIEKTAHVLGHKYRVTVATSDGTEQVIIRSQGCLLLSARDLQAEMARVRQILREEHLDRGPRSGHYLFEKLSEEELARFVQAGEEQD